MNPSALITEAKRLHRTVMGGSQCSDIHPSPDCKLLGAICLAHDLAVELGKSKEAIDLLKRCQRYVIMDEQRDLRDAIDAFLRRVK